MKRIWTARPLNSAALLIKAFNNNRFWLQNILKFPVVEDRALKRKGLIEKGKQEMVWTAKHFKFAFVTRQGIETESVLSTRAIVKRSGRRHLAILFCQTEHPKNERRGQQMQF